MKPVDAMRFSLERIRRGEDTISVTGNVLRDYLTDLFPILELGTSARMLSIVPLMNGGGLFETGAGGSAPKHVQQFVKEGHLRWDSLGEYCALVPSLELVAETHRQPEGDGPRRDARPGDRDLPRERPAAVAQGERDRQPGQHLLPRAVLGPGAGGADRRRRRSPPASPRSRRQLAENEATIAAELLAAQGRPVDLGGYYLPDDARAEAEMRPSTTFNAIIDGMS